MKTTIFELLGMVKAGKAPEKIKYKAFELKRTGCNNLLQIYVDEEGMFFPEFYSGLTLNDEIEIIEDAPKEETKIPEKISTWFSVSETQSNKENIDYANHNFETIYEKINEICDYLKNKSEE